MSDESRKIQRVELSTYRLPVHCIFCGKKVVSGDEGEEQTFSPCQHTLFIATDEGFEYRSDHFVELMKSVEDVDSEEDGYDSITDKVPLENAIKLAIYIPAPAFFGAYIGFAPSNE